MTSDHYHSRGDLQSFSTRSRSRASTSAALVQLPLRFNF